MLMTSNYLVNSHGPAALGSQTLLNAQYLAISKGTPLVLRNTLKRVAVPTIASKLAAANLYYWTLGPRDPIESEYDGTLYPARTRLLRISMATGTALAIGATDWDTSGDERWHGGPGVWWLALDDDTSKYRSIASLIYKLRQLP